MLNACQQFILRLGTRVPDSALFHYTNQSLRIISFQLESFFHRFFVSATSSLPATYSPLCFYPSMLPHHALINDKKQLLWVITYQNVRGSVL